MVPAGCKVRRAIGCYSYRCGSAEVRSAAREFVFVARRLITRLQAHDGKYEMFGENLHSRRAK